MEQNSSVEGEVLGLGVGLSEIRSSGRVDASASQESNMGGYHGNSQMDQFKRSVIHYCGILCRALRVLCLEAIAM
jgi:hypothetical protein